MRKIQEIKDAINKIHNNDDLTYSYREDVIAVLEWVLGEEPFDGMDEDEMDEEELEKALNEAMDDMGDDEGSKGPLH